MIALAFFTGLFLGASLGLLVAGLCRAAKDADTAQGRFQRR